jgi:hypothetical protein
MRENQIDNFTIITIANYGFREFVLNWIMSLNKHGYHKFVVFSFDQALVDYLHLLGFQDKVALVPSDWLDLKLSSDLASWEQENYKKIVKSKTNVWHSLLSRNYSFLFSDPDVVWLSTHILDHIKFQYEHSYAEVLFSQDLEPRIVYCNTGFFFAMATPFVKTLFATILDRSQKNKDSVEQFILRDLLLERRFNDSRVDTLDLLLYANGNIHFNANLNGNLRVKPFIVHANYMVGRDSKVNNLKSRGHWLL